MRENLGDITFLVKKFNCYLIYNILINNKNIQEAYEKTGLILNITVKIKII